MINKNIIRIVQILKKIFIYVFLVLLVLLSGVYIFINTNYGKKKLTETVQQFLSKKLQTSFTLGSVDYRLPNYIELNSIYLEDKNQDSLLYAQKLSVSFGFLKLIQGDFDIRNIELHHTHVHLSRKHNDSNYNFQFIMDAFVSKKVVIDSAKMKEEVNIVLKQLILNHVALNIKDEYAGTELYANIDSFNLRMNMFKPQDLKFKIKKLYADGVTFSNKSTKPQLKNEEEVKNEKFLDFEADELTLKNVNVNITDSYTGLNYKNDIQELNLTKSNLNLKTQTVFINKLELSNSIFSLFTKVEKNPQPKIDTTNNTWNVKVNHILLANNMFEMNNDMPRLSEGFDANHINAKNISLDAKNVNYNQDSIFANIQNLSFSEHSGLKLDTLHTDFLYTTNEISLAELYLKTPKSLLQNNLRLSFDSIQNLTKYPERSEVEVMLQNSVVSMNEVLSLLPKLKQNKSLASYQNEVLKINAQVKGTLDQLDISTLRLETQAKSMINIKGSIQHVTNPNRMMFDIVVLPSQIVKKNYSSFISKSSEADAQLPNVLFMQGNVQGNLNDLAMNMKMHGDDLRLDVKSKLQDMMQPKNLKYDLDLKTLEVQKGLVLVFIPKGKFPEGISLPNTLTLSGVANGDLKNVNTNMHLGGSYGKLNIQGYIKNMNDTKMSNYDLIISTHQFLIGSLLKKDSLLDAVTMRTKIKGKGFDLKAMQTEMYAQISQIGFKQYTYQNIVLQSTISQGKVQSNGTVQDPNIRLDYNLDLDNASNPNVVDLTLNIDTARLHVLNLVKDTIDLATRLQFKSENLSTEKMKAWLKVDTINLTYNTKKLKLDSILVNASTIDNNQELSIQSPVLQMNASGQYDYKYFVPSLMEYINRYIVLGTQKFEKTKPQQIQMEGTIYEHPLIKTVVKGLNDYDSISFKGDFNSNETDSGIHFVMKVPYVDYKTTMLTNTIINLNSSNEIIAAKIKLDSLYSPNGELSKTQILAKVRKDSIEIDAFSKNVNETDKYAFGASIGLGNDSYYVHLKDRLVLNNQIWNVQPSNLIFYSPLGFYVKDFELGTNQSLVSIKSDEPIVNSPISFNITNFIITDLMTLLNQDTNRAAGTVNGKFRVTDFEENLPAFVGDLKIDNLFVNQLKVGDIQLNTKKENENTIHANMNLTGNENDIVLDGNYFLNNTEKQFQAQLDIKQFNIASIEGFTNGAIKNAKGNIAGNIKADGTFKKPIWNGAIQFVDPSFSIPQLGTSYKLSKQNLVLNYPKIEMNDFTISDSANHNLVLNGSIISNTLSDYMLALQVKSNDFIVVNTPRSSNEFIYGFAGVNANVSVKGPMKGPTIQGSISLNDATDATIILPQNTANREKAKSIIRFIDRDTFMLPESVLFVQQDTNAKKLNTPMNYNLNVELSDKASLSMIIDPSTGDELKVSGNAKLNIGVDPGGNILLVGNYDLAKGHYILHYQFLERKFNLLPQSTILFSGNPLDAQLDIRAEYTANTSAIDLVGNELGDVDSKTMNTFNQKISFKVLLFVKGTMKKLDISFDIKMPNEGSGLSNTIVTTVENKLAQLRNDPSAINKQVFSLLVLNRFVGEQSADFFKGNGGGIEDMTRESVSKFLSAALDQIASDLIKGVDIDLNLNSYKDYSSGMEQQRTDLNIGITKRFMDDRLSISLGKDLGIEGDDKTGKSRQQSNASYLPNATINYKLTKDGKYMVRAYSKNKFEVILDGYVVESGMSFLVTMEYEKFRELFKPKKQP